MLSCAKIVVFVLLRLAVFVDCDLIATLLTLYFAMGQFLHNKSELHEDALQDLDEIGY